MVDNCAKIETIKVATVRQFVLVGIVLRSLRPKNFLGAGAISSEKAQRNDYKGSWKKFSSDGFVAKIRLVESCREKMMARVWLRITA
jgi:hypothetical protein